VSWPDWASWVARLRAGEPTALAVLVHGSHARGRAARYSDVDLRVITATPPRVRDRVRLEEHAGRLVHFSIGSRSLPELIELADDPRKWMYVRPQYLDARLLWEEPGTLDLLRGEVDARAPGRLPFVDGLQLALETLLEYATKVRHAHLDGDYVRAAWFARRVGEHAWETVHATAESRLLPSERDWAEDCLSLGGAIPGYRASALVCLGLTPEARSIDRLLEASLDLADAVVTWLGGELARIGPAAGETVVELIESRRTARYLRQLRPRRRLDASPQRAVAPIRRRH
jgi:predicted nucleotidyltransferase